MIHELVLSMLIGGGSAVSGNAELLSDRRVTVGAERGVARPHEVVADTAACSIPGDPTRPIACPWYPGDLESRQMLCWIWRRMGEPPERQPWSKP